MIIYSHRGYKYKENTYKSLNYALKYFDGIEFDVRLTKDKIPVVIHDHNLIKTHKLKDIIHLNNYEKLKKYNIYTHT